MTSRAPLGVLDVGGQRPPGQPPRYVIQRPAELQQVRFQRLPGGSGESQEADQFPRRIPLNDDQALSILVRSFWLNPRMVSSPSGVAAD